MTENTPITRRDLLRSCLGVAVGAAAGATVLPQAAKATIRVTEQVTDVPPVSAYEYELITDQCGPYNEADPSCRENLDFGAEDRANIAVISPVIEELVFRGFPAFVINAIDDKSTYVRGEPSLGLTRNELIAGAASSLAFGAAHLSGREGVNTNLLPVGQTICGMGFWYLARKFGLSSSVSAHIIGNATQVY